MTESQELELIRSVWERMAQGDLSALEKALAEDARWRTVWEGATNCEGRGTIVETIGRNLAGLHGSIDEMVQAGPCVIVGFRSGRGSEGIDRPLDNGLACMVVTIHDGKITELKGCADRVAATRYAETGEAEAVPLTPGPHAPDVAAAPTVRDHSN